MNLIKMNKYLVFQELEIIKHLFQCLKIMDLILKKIFEFPDHYNYKKKDIDKIINKAKKLKL